MHGHTHHLPGRLRLRFSQLRHNPAQLNGITGAMRTIDGVLSVEASSVTGGLLIHYETASANRRKFWNEVEAALIAHGLHHDPRQGCPPPSDAATGVGRKLANDVAGVLVDKLIERSAIALVAALL